MLIRDDGLILSVFPFDNDVVGTDWTKKATGRFPKTGSAIFFLRL